MSCYSDHNEDVRTKGSCDYCGDTTLDIPSDLRTELGTSDGTKLEKS